MVVPAHMTTVIITMAGHGRRFSEAGYQAPKYRVTAHGRSLFSWAVLSLRGFIEADASFVFVVRADDNAEAFIREEATALAIRAMEVVQLSAPTDGQATTALMARPGIADRARPLLIYNIDTLVLPSALPPSAVRGEGWIPCFPAEGDAWSFAAADASGRVHEVREKKRISPNATIGLYWFASFDLFERAYTDYYHNPANIEKGERYIAPIYNELIAAGRDVFIHHVPPAAVFPLGTPAVVEHFSASDPPSV